MIVSSITHASAVLDLYCYATSHILFFSRMVSMGMIVVSTDGDHLVGHKQFRAPGEPQFRAPGVAMA